MSNRRPRREILNKEIAKISEKDFQFSPPELPAGGPSHPPFRIKQSLLWVLCDLLFKNLSL